METGGSPARRLVTATQRSACANYAIAFTLAQPVVEAQRL